MLLGSRLASALPSWTTMAKPIAKVSQLMSKFNANMAQENTHCRDFATSFLMAAPPSIAAVTLVQLDQAIAQVRHAPSKCLRIW